MDSLSRRQVLGAGGVLGAAAALGTPTGAAAASAARRASRPVRPVQEETSSLDELYADALKEGGELVIYAGGDTADQQDGTKQAFLSQFPDIKLTLVVDYSKYHDVRIDNQLATDTLVPDVVQLQTLQDLVRWKDAGGTSAVQAGRLVRRVPALQGPGRRLGRDRGVCLQLHVRRQSRQRRAGDAGGPGRPALEGRYCLLVPE
jgi:hypothetical protein